MNEIALVPERTMHPFAARFRAVVVEELEQLVVSCVERRALVWDDFRSAWLRIVRRVLFGDVARDDALLIEMLDRLRADANWAFAKPRRTRLRERFLARIRRYLVSADPRSPAALAAAAGTPESATEHQVPQWLFAFDSAGIATFRAMALLAAHSEAAERARSEIGAGGEAAFDALPFLRACVLESIRLWPTTPMLLRQTTRETQWEGGAFPARTGLMIFVPYVHRSRDRPAADRFAPELWLRDGASPDVDGRARGEPPLVPFSAGPAMCPGRQLVLLVASAFLAGVLERFGLRLETARLDPARPLPGTLDHHTLRFVLEPRSADRAETAP